MPTRSATPQPEAVIEMRGASKVVVEGVNHSYIAFQNLSLDVYPGERLAIFGVNGYEAKALVACLSGVEPLDGGKLESNASVSWPLGSNDAFSGKLSGYVNARFVADVYSQPGQVEDTIKLIQELTRIEDDLFHKPVSDWSGVVKDRFKLAVSLAFEFDVITVGRIKSWDHRAVHPHAARIREVFEQRIEGRTLIVFANGQPNLALDYCEEGLALANGELVYRGDPEVCLELVQEEASRVKKTRRERVNARITRLLDGEEAEDDFEQDASDGPSLDARVPG